MVPMSLCSNSDLSSSPVVVPLSKVVYLLTTDPLRGEDVWVEADRFGLRLQVLFPKELPVPGDAAAVVVDLDYMWMDEHEKRRYVTQQLFQPLHAVTTLVSRTVDWSTVPLHRKPTLAGFTRLDSEVLRWLSHQLSPLLTAR